MPDNKKVARTFQCRETLWQKFEQMASELECSVDYLINDSMKQYARSRGYGASIGPQAATLAPPPAAPVQRSLRPPPPPAGAGAPPPLPGSGPPAQPSRRAPPPPPPARRPSQAQPPPPTRAKRSAPPPPPAPARVSSGAPPPSRSQGPLNLYYMGQRFPITKERFIIGRGKQSSDLTIKDPNVSRQHAMIEYLNGQYYIVDMGSTNGVEFAGQRVQRRAVNEGDTFRVCDHELRFSYN